jgi:hypothetical protein
MRTRHRATVLRTAARLEVAMSCGGPGSEMCTKKERQEPENARIEYFSIKLNAFIGVL